MLRLRVRGYLRKDVSRKHLVSVIRSTMSDDRSVLISVSKPVMLGAGGTGDGEGPLSAREGGLLELVTQALSNRQIAGRLGITEGTVKRHLHNMFTKLGAVSRTDAVDKALDAGLITPPPQPAAPTTRSRGLSTATRLSHGVFRGEVRTQVSGKRVHDRDP